MRKNGRKSDRKTAKNGIGIREIARVAGVAVGTVDRALHSRSRISEATRQKVLKVAKGLGYSPNLAARMLRVGQPNLRVAVSIPREPSSFYDQIRDGILDEARRFESLGVEVMYRPIESLGVGETERVKEIIAEGVQGLILTPGDPIQMTPLIDEAEQKNIRVVCVASDAPKSSRSSVVCVEPALNGRLAAELMSWLVPSESEVAVITGMLHTEDHLKKAEGFSRAFPGYCPGGKIVDIVEGYGDDEITFQKCLALLGKFRHLAGLYVNICLPLPVCHALSARRLSGKVRLIGTDLSMEMVPYLLKGTISAAIYQSPYLQGQYALRLIADHVLSGRPVPSSHYLNPNVIMRSNLNMFRETRQTRNPDIIRPAPNRVLSRDGSGAGQQNLSGA